MPFYRYLFVIGLLIISLPSKSQHNKALDSLKALIKSHVEDSTLSRPETILTIEYYLSQAKKEQSIEDIIYGYQQLAAINYKAGNINSALRYYKLYAVELEQRSDFNKIKQDRFEKNLYKNEIKALNEKIRELEDEIATLNSSKEEFYNQNYWILTGLKVILGILLIMLIVAAYYKFRRPKSKPIASAKPTTAQTITDVLDATKDQLTKTETELDLADILVQQIITHPEEYFNENKSLRKKLLIHQPKKLAGGDGLYLSSSKGKTLVIVFDAPGNGATGGLLSSQVYKLLDNLVRNHNLESPCLILNQLEIGLLNLFPAGVPFTNGINMAVCLYDASLKTLTFAGANMDLFIAHKQGQTTLLGLGKSILENNEGLEYSNTEIESVRGKNFYLCTNGFWNQSGGFDNKPLGKGSFEKAIESLTQQPLAEQDKVLSKILHDWKGGNEQDDDILVFGFGF